MKSILIVISLLLSFSVNAGDDLKIQASKIADLIPDGDMSFPSEDRCYPDQKINSPRFAISKITTTWGGEGYFFPSKIVITIPASANRPFCGFDLQYRLR